MGMYVNPGNEGFQRIVSDEYMDKTGPIALVNGVIGTPRSLVCVTIPAALTPVDSSRAIACTRHTMPGTAKDRPFVVPGPTSITRA